jgi:hypothetical protein
VNFVDLILKLGAEDIDWEGLERDLDNEIDREMDDLFAALLREAPRKEESVQ